MPTKSTVSHSRRGRPKSIVSQAGEVVRDVIDTITGTEEPRRKARRPGVRLQKRTRTAAGTKIVGRKASSTKRAQPAVKRAKAIVRNLKATPKKRGPKKRTTSARTARPRTRSASTSTRVHH
ncbi:MAG: hypothetical protein ACXVB1_04000 [Pseudobdellovibrionaceae bacterium]